MKNPFIHHSKTTYKLLIVACIGIFSLTACENKTTKVETPTDTLAVISVDTAQKGVGTNNVVTIDTVKPKIDTPAAVKVVEEVKPPKPPKPNQGEGNKKQKAAALPADLVENPDQGSLPEGGYPGFYKFVRENLKYPEQALKEGVEGRVSLKFVVSKDGTVSHIKVTQGIGAGCDEEAMRIVKQSPKWQPAVHKGKNVTSYASTPIIFKIK